MRFLACRPTFWARCPSPIISDNDGSADHFFSIGVLCTFVFSFCFFRFHVNYTYYISKLNWIGLDMTNTMATWHEWHKATQRQHETQMDKWTNVLAMDTHTHTFVRTRSVTIIISECLLAVVAFFICFCCFLVHAGHRVRALTVDSCGVSCDVTFRQTINMTLYSDAASTFVFPWHTTTPSKNPHKMDWCELIVSNLIRVGITLVRHVPL